MTVLSLKSTGIPEGGGISTTFPRQRCRDGNSPVPQILIQADHDVLQAAAMFEADPSHFWKSSYRYCTLETASKEQQSVPPSRAGGGKLSPLVCAPDVAGQRGTNCFTNPCRPAETRPRPVAAINRSSPVEGPDQICGRLIRVVRPAVIASDDLTPGPIKDSPRKSARNL
ncbi:hypothetical protein ACOMHN_060028 [Nucella lapillus]